MPARIFIVIVVTVWLTSNDAIAQPLIAGATSIDATVINADLVFVARIKKVGEAKQIDGCDVLNTTIAILETLKGDLFQDEPHPGMQMEMPFSAVVLADWQERSTNLLVAYDRYAGYAITVIDLTNEKLEVFTAEFKLLREPATIINAAKEALRQTPATVKRVHVFRLDVPPEARRGTSWEKQYLTLDVPADQRLEKRAHEYLRTKSFGPRHEAARALRFFHSEANIALAKSLLQDSTYGIYQPPDKDGIEERYYGVRDEAFHALRTWGVDVERPVIRERKPTR